MKYTALFKLIIKGAEANDLKKPTHSFVRHVLEALNWPEDRILAASHDDARTIVELWTTQEQQDMLYLRTFTNYTQRLWYMPAEEAKYGCMYRPFPRDQPFNRTLHDRRMRAYKIEVFNPQGSKVHKAKIRALINRYEIAGAEIPVEYLAAIQ